MQEKTCCRCKDTKPLSEFTKDKQRKDGLRLYCRACVKVEYSARDKAHRRMVDTARRAQRRKDGFNTPAEKRCGGCKQVLPASSFYISASTNSGLAHLCKSCDVIRSVQYAKDHPERVRATRRKWKERNSPSTATAGAAYRERLLYPTVDEWANRPLKESPGQSQSERRKRDVEALRNSILLAYGGRCYCCGLDDTRFLTIDHVNNDGAEHRRQNKHSYRTLLAQIVKKFWPDDYRLACWNCNSARGKNGGSGYCPHEEDRLRDSLLIPD